MDLRINLGIWRSRKTRNKDTIETWEKLGREREDQTEQSPFI